MGQFCDWKLHVHTCSEQQELPERLHVTGSQPEAAMLVLSAPVPSMQAEGGRALAKGLAANATLSELSLAWNGLEEGASAMGDMLAANMGLKHLDFSHCRCVEGLFGVLGFEGSGCL
jgi:hypothetical protein